MSQDLRWWDIIDESRRRRSLKAQTEYLIAALMKLSVNEIVDFDRFVHEKMMAAYRSDLWDIAYIMNGGCSDDGFDYFLGWLVSRGKDHYEAALANPRAAAQGVSAKDAPFELEDLWCVATIAYERKTGRTDYHDGLAPRVPRPDPGPLFDEETVDQRYPDIARKFGWK